MWALRWLEKQGTVKMLLEEEQHVLETDRVYKLYCACIQATYLRLKQRERHHVADLGSPQEFQKYQDRMNQKEALSLGCLGAFRVK